MSEVAVVGSTSVKSVGFAARSPACFANTFAPTQTFDLTTAPTATSLSRLKVGLSAIYLIIHSAFIT